MTNHYDAILIGGGHNGLVAAGYLARAGLKVLVVERREVLGGAASTEEVFPGYTYDTGAHSLGQLRPDVVHHLDLHSHGLSIVEPEVSVFSPLPDGRALVLSRSLSPTVESIGQFSQADAARWPAFTRQMARLAGVLEALHGVTIPAITTTSLAELLPLLGIGDTLRKLGKDGIPEFLRILPISVAELLDDWFETGVLKGTLGAAGITGMLQGPRATGTGHLFLHQHAGAPPGVFRAARFVKGGMGQLASALASAARAHGAEFRTGAGVAQIMVEREHATSVVLESGEEISARLVVSSADPRRTFLTLVDPQYLDPVFLRQVQNIKMRGAVAKVNLALGELPRFTALAAGGAGAPDALGGLISISPDLDYLEHAYDDAKYGGVSRRPYLEASLPSLADPARAPQGRHVMSILVQYAPYHLKGGWDDIKREALGDAVVEALAEYAPNLPAAIVHRQVLTPVDLEAVFGLTEGNIYHGELMLDQLFFMRPVPGWAQYRTPINNLYLCGAGTHPGGGLTGAPGRNAARAILKDMRSR